jgi:long-chain fatty acid transport protein
MICCAAFLATPALAGSGAYRIEVPDAGAMGKGGAFVGEANTPAAVYYNPAGMTQIVANSISFGVSMIQPKISYSPESGDKDQMKDDSFFVPNFFYVTKLGMERVALGVGATSSWGLVTDWGNAGAIRYNSTRSELSNKDYMVTAAFKATDNLSLGVGLDIDQSKVSQEKKIFQEGAAGDANFKLKGDDTAPGLRVAAMYKVNDRHQFGLLYRGPIHHKYKGKLLLDNLSADPQTALGGFSSQQVFGGPSLDANITSKSTLPQSAVLGYSFKPNQQWVFNADMEWMDWGVVKDQAFSFEDALPTPFVESTIAQAGNPTNRDWHDAMSFNLGSQYSVSERLRLRGGYFFHQTPIPEATMDVGLPDANSNSFTTGFGYDITKDLTFDFAWAAMFYKTRTINNNVNEPFGIDGTYHEWVNLVLATATYSF